LTGEQNEERSYTMNNILYVEDDLSLIDGLKYTLETSGYMVDISRTVKEALTLFKQSQYDLLLLDVTLPDGTGFDICREVRKLSTVPIIFLTASDEEISIVRGLDMGGDDYITKPFKLNELLSRIKALLRRSTQFSKADTILEANGIKIDTIERLVWKKGSLLELTLIEYKLLCLFMQNPNHLLTREMILDLLWDGNGNYVDDNTLSVYIRRLRSKIEDTPNVPAFLLTERGFGYKWIVE
jgi:two-component system response regulator RegX3